MPYVIQGLFFQGRFELGVNYRPGIGTVAVCGTTLAEYLFSGVFWEEGLELKGIIQDAFGVAKVSKIVIDETGVSFRKRYQSRSDDIDYVFLKRDGVSWVGEYSGHLTGCGIARCMVTEVPKSFFEPAAILSVLGRTSAFEAPPFPDAAG